MFKRSVFRNLSISLLAISWAHIANAQCDLEIQPTDPPAKIIKALRCLNSENQQIKSELSSLKAEMAAVKGAANDALAEARAAGAGAEEAKTQIDRMFTKTMRR